METKKVSPWLKLVVFGGVLYSAFALSVGQKTAVDTEAMRNVSVSVRAISNVSIDTYGDSVWAPSSGSGFLVSNETCEVWTNHHVIEDAAVVEVFPRGWKESHGIIAEVINSTPQMDVAILRMGSCDGLPAAMLGNSDRVATGDETFAVGNPFGRNPDSVSRGIISHTERYLAAPAPYLQTDAAVNPGNSGGALFNEEGVVIGLTTAIANNKSGSNVVIGYALPINKVIDVVADLRSAPPSWGYAGLKGHLAALTAKEAAIFKVEGGGAAVSVMNNPSEGPSTDKIFARDVIYQVDGEPVTNPSHVHRMIGSKKPGESVAFSLIRNGEFQTVQVELEEGWNEDQKVSKRVDSYNGLLGMQLEMWTEFDAMRGQYNSPVITKIHSLGPAHRGFIVSSQSSVAMRGPIVAPVQLSVRTITGAVIDGKYKPISDIPTLNKVAMEANEALLLEIESWGRNPKDINQPMRRSSSAFYRVLPEPSPDQISKQKQSNISNPFIDERNTLRHNVGHRT